MIHLLEKLRQQQSSVVFDADAQAFITNAGITDPTQQGAINTLVVGLKADSLWTKMKAIYPFVGGTATTHKFNLKDPQDTDGAYRLTFNGGFNHSSDGCSGNGTAGTYAHTHLAPNNMAQNSVHMSFYNKQANDTSGSVEIGLLSGSVFYLAISYVLVGLDFISNINNTGSSSYAHSSNQGFWVSSRIVSGSLDKYKNGSLVANPSATSSSPSSSFITLFRNTATERSNKLCAFASIGDGLDSTDVGNLYTLVQAYNTTLSRQV